MTRFGIDTDPGVYESVTTFERKEHKTVVVGRGTIGQRSETVRRANLGTIVRELHEAGPLSRSELVARTGLTRSAIRKLTGELVAAGLVTQERGAPLGTPGRPSPLVYPDPRRTAVLALEIAVDSLAVAVVGLGGQVIVSERVDRPRGHLSVDQTVADLVALAASVRARGPDCLIGVGVAVVGVVRRADGFVSMAPNLGWRDVPLGDRLAQALGTAVPIAVGNEADLGGLAELRRGAARGTEDVLFISGEVGVGGGVIVDGRPLTGAAGYGGEVGHFPINPGGVPCGCGSVGCWETEIGEGALLARAGRSPAGGSAEVDAVLEAAAAGSPAAVDALDSVGRWLGLGVAGLVNIFNPRLVVLGGLFGRIHPFVARTLEDTLDRRALPAPRLLVRIVPAELGVDAPLLGAAELAFEPILGDPGGWFDRAQPTVLATA
jgi:predicted NBD/HSP70 family sugar kinase